MGSETQLEDNPRFIVRALGSFEQKPGCPDYAVSALGKERIELLCKNECYNPSNIRREIERIEVIKILPQRFENENLDNLIIDPWKVFNCGGTEECVITFSDNNFSIDKRDALYYVRAIEKESKAVNANNTSDFSKIMSGEVNPIESGLGSLDDATGLETTEMLGNLMGGMSSAGDAASGEGFTNWV